MPCNCYVRHLSKEAQYVIRCGAHNPACPWYRPSLDPVDRLHDDDFRQRTEIAPPATDRLREFEFEDAAIDGWEV